MANTDYGAVLLTTCEATSQALNHRLGVSTGFKPSEWADNINLLVKPAEKSASGSVAHFTDGLDMPLVSLSCDVTAWQEGTGTASPSNPRPIHGWSEANVNIIGSNMLDLNNIVRGTINASTGDVQIAYQRVCTNDIVSVVAGKTYTIDTHDMNVEVYEIFEYVDGVKLKKLATANTSRYSFTIDDTVNGVRVSFKYTHETNILPEALINGQWWENTTGTSLNIPFGQTVYGGSLNVMTGELTITHGYILLKDQTFSFTKSASTNFDTFYLNVKNLFTGVKQTDYADFVCDKFNGTTTQSLVVNDAYIQTGWLNIRVAKDEYDTGTAFTNWVKENGLYVAYELATPTTITLTPHQMSSLLGENNIWADCGDSAVVYRGMVGDSFKCFFNSQVTSGWTGTSVERTMLTVTGNGNGSITFDNNGKGRTNCSNSDGYISVRKNGTAVYTKSLAQNTDETLAIPAVNFSAGDVITLVFGFANYHSNINMKLTGDSFTVQGSATVSGISNTTNTSTTLEVST